MRKKKNKYQNGMTLIELVVTLAIMGIISFTLTPFFKVQLESYLDIRQGKSAMQSARIGFNRMISEIKRIDDSLDISYASSTRIDFDIPNDGLGFITYEYDGLYLRLEREGHKLVESVRDFDIKYYRNDGTEKATPFYFDSDVWRIEINISVGTEANQIALSGQISPRNLHYQ